MAGVNVDNLTTEELAARWKMSVSSLEHWRCSGKGPRFRRFGLRKVLYPLVEVERYEAENLFQSVHIQAPAS